MRGLHGLNWPHAAGAHKRSCAAFSLFTAFFPHQLSQPGVSACKLSHTIPPWSTLGVAPRSRPLVFFFFETTSSAPRLHQHLAVLLAHPQLRDDQEAVAAKLSRPLCDDGDDRSEVVMSAAC